MRLIQDRSAGAQAVSVPCAAADHIGRPPGNSMFTLSQGFADIDGPPFQAYFCGACARRLAPEQVERAIAEETERANKRSY